MSKSRKLFVKIILAGSLLVFMLILAGFIWLHIQWRTMASPTDMRHNASLLNNTPALPDSFYKVWDKIHPGSRHATMDRQLMSDFFFIGNWNCWCDEIGYTSWSNNNLNFKYDFSKQLGRYREFAYGLQKYSSPEKCFDFWINNDIFYQGRYLKSLDEFSQIILNKPLDSLSIVENIKLIVYLDESDHRKWNIDEVFEEYKMKYFK